VTAVSLPVPFTTKGVAGLAALLARPRAALVGLDFDGTLAPIVPDPDQARPHPAAGAALRGLAPKIGTVAVLTGRPPELAAAMLGLDAGPAPDNLVIAGHYGLQTWTPSGGVVPYAGEVSGDVEAVRRAIPGLLAAVAAPDGTTVEDKGAAIAVHVRRTADPSAAMALLREPLSALANESGLRLEQGRMVLELRPDGVDKGIALESLAADRHAEVVCFIGDDLGDLAAFAAIERLRDTGLSGLAICSGSDEVPELMAAADLVVDGPDGVVAFLAELTVALGE
jgi:trehalose 6-phosphate phosphatase